MLPTTRSDGRPPAVDPGVDLGAEVLVHHSEDPVDGPSVTPRSRRSCSTPKPSAFDSRPTDLSAFATCVHSDARWTSREPGLPSAGMVSSQPSSSYLCVEPSLGKARRKSFTAADGWAIE